MACGEVRAIFRTQYLPRGNDLKTKGKLSGWFTGCTDLEADVFKITMLELHRSFKRTGRHVKIVHRLHDGIWYTCPDESATVARVIEIARKVMGDFVKLSVPPKGSRVERY